MIRNILFDMGNVLIYFDRNLFMDRLGVAAEDKKLLMREVFLSVEWVRMDRGSMVEADVVASCCKRLPEHLHDAAEKLIQMWDRPILPIPGMYDLIEELKGKGCGIYLLSNASDKLHAYFHRLPGADCFDGRIVSADWKLLKPQAEIYQTLYSTFHLDPAECVFIDDAPANVDGAMMTGMQAIVFYGDVTRLRRELRELGIPVSG